MLGIATGKIIFPKRGDFGPQDLDETISFPRRIRGFVVGLTGFEVKFDDDEHEFHKAIVDVKGNLVDPTTIEVKCTLGLRDHSDHWDDPYSGYIAYAVVAEVEEPPVPSITKLSGFIHSLKTIDLAATHGLLVQLYVPIDEKLIDLTFDLSNDEPTNLVLAALLRDALAMSLPVTCDAASYDQDSDKKQYNTLVNVEIKTRKSYHQAGYTVSKGEFRNTGEKAIGNVHGKIRCISVGAFGLIKGANDDLPDVAQVFVEDKSKKMTELFLGLQRADLDTYLSQLTMLLEAYRSNQEIAVGYYLEPLFRDDAKKVKWILYVQIGVISSLNP